MKFAVSCTIVQLDDSGEIVEGYDGDLEFAIELDTNTNPVRFLLDTLHPLPQTSDFCT